MAEQLGEVVLKFSADTSDYDRKVQQARQTAIDAGRAIDQGLNKPINRPYGPIPPPPPPLRLPQADTTALTAGLKSAEQQARQTAQSINQAFGTAAQGPSSSIRSIQALQAKLQSLRASYETVQIGSKGFRDLQREIQKTEQELQKVDKTLGATFRERAGGFGASLLGGLGIGVGIGAGAAVGGFIKDSIQQATELETVTRKLSNTLGNQGASAALNFIKGLSNDLGLNFKELAGSFGSFTAAATSANIPLQVQKDLFGAVAQAGSALGLSNDEVNGSLLALQQVASKGTVAMEELRGQLGERLPIALSATAKGLGISQQELIKLVESGKLTAGQFFPALTKGLNELTSGAGGVPTAAQNFAKLGNAWQELQASFGKNLLPGLTSGVQFLTESIKGLGAAARANVLADTFRLGGNDAATLSGGLDFLQQKYNVNDANAQQLLRQAIQESGAGTNIFGQLTFTGEQFAKVQLRINDLFEEFRKKYPDVVAAAQAKAAAEQANAQATAKATLATQKQLDIDLQRNQAALQLKNLQEGLAAAKASLGLDDAERTALQNRLSLNEKIRAVQADQLQLQRELAKPAGIGDGKPLADGTPTQNLKAIEDLQNKIQAGRVQVATLRIQNQQADAAALRTQQDRIRQQQLEVTLADNKLAITQQQTQLEREALTTGGQVSATDLLRLRTQEAITQKLEQQKAARQALQAELAKPANQQDRVVIDDLINKQAKANADVRQAYADAGLSLVQNARSAADSLKSAQQSFNSTARGSFDLLTSELQGQQIAVARQSVANAIGQGLIRGNVDIGTTEQLFRVAGVAESLTNANDVLKRALEENAKATKALETKDWNVYVNTSSSPPSPTPSQAPSQGLPSPSYGVINGIRIV